MGTWFYYGYLGPALWVPGIESTRVFGGIGRPITAAATRRGGENLEYKRYKRCSSTRLSTIALSESFNMGGGTFAFH